MSGPRPPLESYTVGIICALPIEMAAVTAMLDEVHADLEFIDGDENTYALGRVGTHNVVAACLPAAHIGKDAAAMVAINMRRSFPITIGLLVGVGGGVWSRKADVRLGDVVVSQPRDAHEGVLQFDFGKMEHGGQFRRLGPLNKPPRELLHAVQTLKTRHLMRGNAIPRALEEMKERNPFMASALTYPGCENDRYFDKTYSHQGELTCDECDCARLVERLPVRADPSPQIHYGTIASGPSVMRDGHFRDRMTREEGILCFEMEAAGVMDIFPCLVIRGISNYADSHKNDVWQPYAAAVAAAYAKELLLVVRPNPVQPARINVPVPDIRWSHPNGDSESWNTRCGDSLVASNKVTLAGLNTRGALLLLLAIESICREILPKL